ncbi:MAG: sensor histidine kinase [Dehalococcoidia bacterium]
MTRSLRNRLLFVMVAIPVLALVSVAIAVRVSSDSNIDSRLSFEIVPVRRVGGGLTNPDDDPAVMPVFETKIDLSNSQPVTFVDTGTGEQFTIQADRGFVDAFEKDSKDAISSINRQVTIAAIGVAVVALAVSFWLSRRIVHPIEKLTTAAKRLESGDLGERVRVRSTDEIGMLGHAFNAMAQSIERGQNLRRQMTSDVAHELRTPLNNISGYLDAIADGVVAPDDTVIASLQEEASLLVSLVNDLEQLSLADAGRQILRLERISLNELAARVVAAIAPRARAGRISIETELSPVPAIEGDASRLGQVIRNLLENAITHTPNGGRIQVTLTSTERSVSLAIRDTGAGIDPEHLPFIFERFYRADPSRARATGGAGLGLAIVRQLVEVHGGTVSAENIESGGARFTVQLPIPQAMPASFGSISRNPLPRPS